jgi:ribosomal-protein-alanine acetyltransferase
MLSRTSPEIRPAAITDIPALINIENTRFETDRISARSFRRFIARDSAAILVRETGNAIIGYVLLLFRKNASVARLYSIAVAPGHEGRGLGRQLIEAAEAEAVKRGKKLLRLEVRDGNITAIRLYQQHGFRQIGLYHNYYSDHADALRFEKVLQAPA